MADEHKVEVSKSNGGSPLLLFPEIIGFFALPFFLFKDLLTGNPLIGGLGLILWFFGLIYLLVCLRRRRYYLAGLPILILFGFYLLAKKVLGS